MNGRSEVEKDFPSQSFQQIVSDDDEIDYSSKPEFYDPEVDEKDEVWVQKQRRGRTSDAALSCPACFTTLCLDCQRRWIEMGNIPCCGSCRHEKYVTRYRAIFVVNCRIKDDEVSQPGSKRTRNRNSWDTFKCVCCSVCSTDVGVIDEDGVYHFLNVLPSEA